MKLIKAVDFYCAGMSFLLNEWISNDMIESPEMVKEWMCEFVSLVLLDAWEFEERMLAAVCVMKVVVETLSCKEHQ